MCFHQAEFDIVFLGFDNGLFDKHVEKLIEQLFGYGFLDLLATDLTDTLAGTLLFLAFILMHLENGQKFYFCGTLLGFDSSHKIEKI